MCLAWLLVTSAQAQVPDAVAAEPPVDALRADLAAAVDAYEAQDWATARALFERVHAAAPTARTLIALVTLGDAAAPSAQVGRESARLRKRFQVLKTQLRARWVELERRDA